MGKPGREISRARQKVLEILETENSCSSWYRSKDSDPAATFRTLTFVLDLGGDVFVRVTNQDDGTELVRNPYVASVTQGNGPHATVTLNRNGAFFFPMATAREEARDGGPLILHFPRKLQVGPYLGGTLSAQVATMLHEFGHLLDLLPPDWDDYAGKSRQNTTEVLRFCRAQVESKETPHTVLASQ